MFHNFESWRKSKQEKAAPKGAAHYHLCEDACYLQAISLLKTIVSGAINNRSMILRFASVDSLDAVLTFIIQMEDAYIHPRSTSHRFRFAAEGFPPANSHTL